VNAVRGKKERKKKEGKKEKNPDTAG